MMQHSDSLTYHGDDQESPLMQETRNGEEMEEIQIERSEQKEEKQTPPLSSLLVVYLTVFIDLFGFGIIVPVLPFFALKLGANGVGLGAITSSFAIFQCIGNIILGRLSDKYGRKNIILIGLAGSVIGHSLLGLSETLVALCFARGVAGIFGGTIPVAQAYIADVTAPEERAKYMGLLGASQGLGFVLGPALGGVISGVLKGSGFSVAAFTAAGITLTNLIMGIFLLKDPPILVTDRVGNMRDLFNEILRESPAVVVHGKLLN